METNAVVKDQGVGGFLPQNPGHGSKSGGSIGTAIDKKIDKLDETLALQLKYKDFSSVSKVRALIMKQVLESKSTIVEPEAKGESWLQRNWRPMVMCICLFIVFLTMMC